MVNKEQLSLIKKGVSIWNEWIRNNADTKIDFSNANLSGVDLYGVNLRGANLRGANLMGADLCRADLSGVNLSYADLSGAKISNANLSYAILRGAYLFQANLIDNTNLSYADLTNANLTNANLTNANLTNANLSYADLSRANMVGTNFNKANLTDCRIYGISAWDLKLGTEKDNNLAIQKNLIITPQDEPNITVDNLEVAQFIYLLLKNKNIRDVIDTLTSKVVLILGRFASERMKILDALREELRKRNYSPVLFDFEKPDSRDLMETVTLLARMARFIIADITDAKNIIAELERIVPDLPSVPVQPLMLRSDCEFALFDHIKSYSWVLPIHLYDTREGLLAVLGEAIITPAEKKLLEIREKSSRN